MDYDEKVKKNRIDNEKYLSIFKDYLEKENLSTKTINNHCENVRFYLNDYLNYYDGNKMEDGIYMISGFLGNWFIEKCTFASKTSIKEHASSIKKFYKCMLENNFIKEKDYKELSSIIKEEMNDWLQELEEYDKMLFSDY